jgi:hypothetical protein
MIRTGDTMIRTGDLTLLYTETEGRKAAGEIPYYITRINPPFRELTGNPSVFGRYLYFFNFV